jgi:hypothetical protein
MNMIEESTRFWKEVGNPFLMTEEGQGMTAQQAADYLNAVEGEWTVNVDPAHVNNHRTLLRWKNLLPQVDGRTGSPGNGQVTSDDARRAAAENLPPVPEKPREAKPVKAKRPYARKAKAVVPELPTATARPLVDRSKDIPVRWGLSEQAFRQAFDVAVAEVRRLEQIAKLVGIDLR